MKRYLDLAPILLGIGGLCYGTWGIGAGATYGSAAMVGVPSVLALVGGLVWQRMRTMPFDDDYHSELVSDVLSSVCELHVTGHISKETMIAAVEEISDAATKHGNV